MLNYSAVAGGLLLSFYVIPYLLDPHNYRRRFSGPWPASFTNAWMSSVVKSGKSGEALLELHKQYGTFVRIGPNHISIADPEALEAVYKHGSGLLKSDYYEMFKLGEHGIFSTQDKSEHSTMRRRLAHIFSPQNILSYEPRVRNNIRRFVTQWDLRCQQAAEGRSGFNWRSEGGCAILNVCPQIAYLAFDLIGDLTLGSPFGMIEAQRDTTRVAKSLEADAKTVDLPLIEMFDRGTQSVSSLAVYPWWAQTAMLLLPWNLFGLFAARNLIGFSAAALNQKLQRTDGAGNSKQGADMVDKLLEARDEHGNPLPKQVLIVETFGMLFAGSDTTSNSLSAMCFYLAKHPRTQRKLQAELDEHVPLKSGRQDEDSNATPDPVVTYQSVKDLPYLNACLKETLRLHSTVGVGLPRVVPAGKSITIAGQTFEAGCTMSVPSFVTNRANVWGQDAEDFRPERWLEDTNGMFGKYYSPFSFGTRACIGRNLAIMDMLLIAATIFRRYDIQLAHADVKVSLVFQSFLLVVC
ncbi:cytochrome P450 family monooxygenase [Rhizoctonia solani AG-3 Rhs1AP]|uniref:Cytochrome P450 family monooxygenase n=1 Tax=Rhizoctonia solani AG-3 Rhs1AP TaxID=1086054 RepID=X8JBE8_9AGAM|nr:cytochrome P450 family monooxygenase [Rhizoctonia solani AG-3 Rhs1AP]